MSTYKVIQDIEAEDKLLGPMSFRQFLYFLGAAFLGFLNFTSLANGLWPVLIVLGPPMLFCLFFAWPWSPDQPTEVFALARIRYYFKPRKRLWNQSGVKEFVTITVPKKIEKHYTDGLTQDQVRSRLEALSRTIDSRGWAIKNAYDPNTIQPTRPSDRLVDFSAMPREVSSLDVAESDDILDAQYNPAAQQMGQLINASSKAHRQLLLDKLRTQGAEAPVAEVAPQWFRSSQQTAAPATPLTVPLAEPATQSPIPTAPVAVAAPQAQQAQAEPIKSQPNPVILNLAHDDDKDIATLAREAKRARSQELGDDEVVVSLH